MSVYGYRDEDLRALTALRAYMDWTRHDRDVSKLTPPKRVRSRWLKRKWVNRREGCGYVLTRLGQRELAAFTRRVKS